MSEQEIKKYAQMILSFSSDYLSGYIDTNTFTANLYAANSKITVDKRSEFLPQPAEIEKELNKSFEGKKEFDEFGWTGEYSLSPKNVLDIILNLQDIN